MNTEIVSVVLTGAGVLLGVWRIQAQLQREIQNDITALTERMARLEGSLDGFMAGFRSKIAYKN